MRFGIVILPEYSWREAAPRWRRAEELVEGARFIHGKVAAALRQLDPDLRLGRLGFGVA